MLHAAGEFSRESPRERRQVGHGQEMGEALPAQGFVDAVEIRIEVHVLRHGEIFVEAEFLGHIAELRLKRRRVLDRVAAEDGECPGGGRHQAAEKAHEGRLPRRAAR